MMRRTVTRVLAALVVILLVSCEGVRPAGNDPLPRRPGAFTELIGPAVARPLISDVGAFRVNCGLSHLNYSDPIVAPGKPLGSHLHQFFGNTGTDWRSTAASIASTGGSTCTGGTLTNVANGWYLAGVTGALPTVTPSSLTPSTSSNIPRMGVRFS